MIILCHSQKMVNKALWPWPNSNMAHKRCSGILLPIIKSIVIDSLSSGTFFYILLGLHWLHWTLESQNWLNVLFVTNMRIIYTSVSLNTWPQCWHSHRLHPQRHYESDRWQADCAYGSSRSKHSLWYSWPMQIATCSRKCCWPICYCFGLVCIIRIGLEFNH